MKVDKELLEQQINTLSYLLNTELMGYEIEALEGVLNMLGDLVDSEENIVTVEFI
jgi:hypothetical protein